MEISEDDRGRLIELVREHPALYDQALPEYKQQDLKKQIWDKIAADMRIQGLDGTGASKKWKNITDQYRRCKKTVRQGNTSGSARQEGPRWAHFEACKFLDKVNQPLPSQSNLSVAASQMDLFEAAVADDQSYEGPRTDGGTETESLPESSSGGTDPFITPRAKKARVSTPKDPLEADIKEILQLAKKELTAPPVPPTEKDLFGKLVASMCVPLNEENFGMAQAQIMRVINDIKAKQRRDDAAEHRRAQTEETAAAASLHNYIPRNDDDDATFFASAPSLL